jgi:hypothetical protein
MNVAKNRFTIEIQNSFGSFQNFEMGNDVTNDSIKIVGTMHRCIRK